MPNKISNYDVNKEIKTLTDLIKIIAEIKSDFKKNSVEQNKELLNKINFIAVLIHGERSFDRCNYQPLAVEIELDQIKNKVRLFILQQIIKKAESDQYQDTDLSECWNEFLFAYSLDYGSYGAGGTGWSSHGLAPKAKHLMFNLVLNKLLEKLKRVIKKGTKEEYIKMLQGLKARYNPSSEEYFEVKKWIEKYDPKDKYAHDYI